jgi:hypothetical protein
MVLTRRYRTARFIAQALSVAYAENVTGCKDKQVLFHTTIAIVRTRDFIAFRLANFAGAFSYGQLVRFTQRDYALYLAPRCESCVILNSISPSKCFCTRSII